MASTEPDVISPTCLTLSEGGYREARYSSELAIGKFKAHPMRGALGQTKCIKRVALWGLPMQGTTQRTTGEKRRP